MSTADAALFAALGDPVRLGLVDRLSGGTARSITELAEGLPISRQGVTKHLRILESAGLLTSERQGREIRFRGVPDRLRDARDRLDRIAADWDDALARLKAHVDRQD